MTRADPQRLRIAYLCDLDPRDPATYSGGNARILAALERQGAQVSVLPTRWGLAEPLRRMVAATPPWVEMRLRWRARLALGGLAAGSVNRALARLRPDVVLAAYAIQALAGVRVPKAALCAFTSDATNMTYKASAVGQAFGSALAASRRLDALWAAAEARAARRIDLALWPSEWAARLGEQVLGLGEDRAAVIPWGANLDAPPQPGPPPPIGPGHPLRFVLVGRDWQAKGGPLAVAIVAALRRRGWDAHLAVIGCRPEAAEGVEVIGPLDRADPAQAARFDAEMGGAHFLLQPSIESWGFAFCEAAAWGLPAVCLAEGGVPVIDGETGIARPPGTPAEAFAEAIDALARAPQAHAAMRARARATFEAALNWDAWARRSLHLITRLLEDKRARLTARSDAPPHRR